VSATSGRWTRSRCVEAGASPPKASASCRSAARRAIGRYLELAAARAPEVKLAGLCDAAVCEPDLEVELIRSLGAASVETVLQAQGDLHSFRTFQKQPAQQGRTIEAQLRRFLGTRAGRKAQYARVLVDALDLAQVPRPLEGALAHV
jgi:hypothetical protein